MFFNDYQAFLYYGIVSDGDQPLIATTITGPWATGARTGERETARQVRGAAAGSASGVVKV